LTPREFALLQFLAYHPGQVVTRSMIWEHLYDEQVENISNVVDVIFRFLRKKIAKDFEPPLNDALGRRLHTAGGQRLT